MQRATWPGAWLGTTGGDKTCSNQLIASNSTSNLSVELGGMTGGKPRAPYACERMNREAGGNRKAWSKNEYNVSVPFTRGEKQALSRKLDAETHVVRCCRQDGLLAQR